MHLIRYVAVFRRNLFGQKYSLVYLCQYTFVFNADLFFKKSVKLFFFAFCKPFSLVHAYVSGIIVDFFVVFFILVRARRIFIDLFCLTAKNKRVLFRTIFTDIFFQLGQISAVGFVSFRFCLGNKLLSVQNIAQACN